MRKLRSITMAFAVAIVASMAQAQTWPARPVTLVVGTSAGSGLDTIGRFLAQGLRERTGQAFVIENRAGAAGNIGAQSVARAAPDGYTAFVGTISTHAINPYMLRNVGIDPVRDFQPVTTIFFIGFILIANPQLPVNSVAELSAYLKAHPGQLAYASGNQFGRIMAEWYRQIAGFDALHVPYKSVPQALGDLFSGRVHFIFVDATVGISTVQSGKARALAVTGPKRNPGAPEIPTMIESGVPGFVADGWVALFFPARTPIEIARKLADLSNDVMTTDKAREFLRKAGAEPMPGSPESLAKSVVEDNAKWGTVIRKAGIEAE